VQRGDGERRGCALLAGQGSVRVPRVLADGDGVLVLEALAGRRLDHLDGDDLESALLALGRALAALHTTVPVLGTEPPAHRDAHTPRVAAAPEARAERAPAGAAPEARPERAPAAPLAPFSRLDPSRLATAAAVVARARPDAADAAERLLARLLERADDAQRPAVCLHGDANLRNALLLADGRVALLDLEHVAAGPAAADLGQVLAAMLGARRQAAAALLSGYAGVTRPPDRAALRWHASASILARVALPAVSRYRPRTLAQLRALLDAGSALLAPAEVAA
jgi:aminoglycoside phosphotransferase (APT) family kinase protein